jgi:hypothetical protein
MSRLPFRERKIQLGTSYVQQVLAFPTNAACFRRFFWHATCWLEPVTIGTLPIHIYNRIRSQVRPDLGFGGPLVQLYEFGGPQRYHEADGVAWPRDERLLLVFPYLEEDILEEARLQKWMEQVVIPAIFESLSAATLPHFHHTSMRLIRLNSQAARVEGMKDVPDTQLDFYLQPEELELAWQEIQTHSERAGFEVFRGVRPVILGQYSPLRFHGGSPHAAFQELMQEWDHTMRMEYIPHDGLYMDFVTGGYGDDGGL